MRSTRLLGGSSVVALGFALLTCGEGSLLEPDAGSPSLDAWQALDAAWDDAGREVGDAGADVGAAPADAAQTDAAGPDAGVGVDASARPDAGLSDAASPGPDAGAAADASRPDAATWCTAGGIPGACLDVAECYGTRDPTAGLCPGSSSIQCCTPRYAVDCDPNAVPQPNAGLVEEPGVGGCPAGMLRVLTFCVDRFEGSLEEILADGRRVPWSPYSNPAGHRVRAVSLRGAVPQGYLTQIQATAACQEAGKRLCTDAEWLRACRGPSNTTYPYGNTR